MGAKNFVTKKKKDNEKYKSDKINFCNCIVKDSYSKYIKANTFCVFKSIYDIFLFYLYIKKITQLFFIIY